MHDPALPQPLRRPKASPHAEMTTGEREAWERGLLDAAAIMEGRALAAEDMGAEAEASAAAVILRYMAARGPR